jgi:signal recognition particle GTPase
MRSGAQKNKLIIIMVGLPGRGKTFLCNKLKCYLNWWVLDVYLACLTCVAGLATAWTTCRGNRECC